jgi:hypothetical protein
MHTPGVKDGLIRRDDRGGSRESPRSIASGICALNAQKPNKEILARLRRAGCRLCRAQEGILPLSAECGKVRP